MNKLHTGWLLGAMLFSAKASEVNVDVTFFDDFETPVASVFRIGALQLRDPHVFYNVPIGPTVLCTDVTDVPSIGLNAQIAASLAQDSEPDGILDSSAMLVFQPLRSDTHPAYLQSRAGACSVATPRSCTPGTGNVDKRIYRSFNTLAPIYCMEAVAGTTSTWGGGAVAVPRPGGLCYSSAPSDLVLSTAGLQIPLFNAQYAAPMPDLVNNTGGGLMRGFLRESDANTINVDFNGGTQTLASLLPGGLNSCRADLTGGKDNWNGDSGWWFYFEYRQDPVQASGF